MSAAVSVMRAGATRVLAVTLLGALALGACGRKPRGAGDVPKDYRVTGLALTDAKSVLSWQAVPGATEYGVTVVGENGTPGLWVWTGSQTSITYGVADLPVLREDTTVIPIGLPARPARALRPGGHYRWLVVALDAQGHARAVSDVQHFTAPGPAPASQPPAQKAVPPRGRVAAMPDVGAMMGMPSVHPCDVVTRAKLADMLGHDPGEAERQGSACRYMHGRLVLLTGPTSVFEGVRAMLKISPTMVDQVPDVGDGAYWMKLPLGGQLTAKKGATGASITVMDSTLSKERPLEVARTLARALLENAPAGR